jgi:hypothetical protein
LNIPKKVVECKNNAPPRFFSTSFSLKIAQMSIERPHVLHPRSPGGYFIHQGFGEEAGVIDKAKKSIYCVGGWMESAENVSSAKSRSGQGFGLKPLGCTR